MITIQGANSADPVIDFIARVRDDISVEIGKPEIRKEMAIAYINMLEVLGDLSTGEHSVMVVDAVPFDHQYVPYIKMPIMIKQKGKKVWNDFELTIYSAEKLDTVVSYRKADGRLDTSVFTMPNLVEKILRFDSRIQS